MFKAVEHLKGNSVFLGVLFMLIHALAMASVQTFGAQLTKVMTSSQVAFLYKFSIFFAILPWCSKGGLVNNLRTKRFGLHFTRGIFSGIANICFYKVVQVIYVADAAAVSYLEQVLLLCIGIFYFNEKLTVGKLVMISSGIVGTLMIIKPGFKVFDKHYIYLFIAILLWSVNNVSIKVLGKTEHSKAQVFYATLFGSLMTFPLAMSDPWPEFSLLFIKPVIILGIFHFIHSISFFKALKLADMTVVMPFEYTRIIFASILGWIFLSRIPDTFSLIGYIMIMLGGTYLVIEEGRRRKWRKELQAEFATTDVGNA